MPGPSQPTPQGSAVGAVVTTLAWLAVGAAAGGVIAALAAPNDPRRRALNPSRPSTSAWDGAVHAAPDAAGSAGSSGARPPRRKEEFTIREPRGVRWEQLTRDFDGADAMPTAFTPDVAKFWESVPTHLKPDDPFAKHEGFVEALVASKRLPVAQLEQIMRDTPRTFPLECVPGSPAPRGARLTPPPAPSSPTRTCRTRCGAS